MTVGPDGIPRFIRVAGDWERRIGPERFGAAVTEAAQVAHAQGMQAVAEEMERTGFRSDAPSVSRGRGAVPPAFGGPPREPVRRSPQSLVAEMLETIDAVERSGTPAPAMGVGRAAGGRLTVTLAGDITVSCTADAHWAAGKSSGMMSDAFGRALEEARTEYQRARRESDDRENPANKIHGLVGEAIAMLNDMGKR